MDYKISSPWEFIIIRQLDKYMSGHKGYIAGGCFKNIFNNEQFKDIDIFFESSVHYSEAVKYYKENEDYVSSYENDKVKAFRNIKTNITIELIKHKFLSVINMLEDFDFTITKFAYYKHYSDEEDGDSGKTIEYKTMYHNDYFTHLHMKRLVIDKPANKIMLPVNTFNRAFKYARYGYFPCRQTKIKIINSLRNISGDTEDLLSLQLYDGID